MQRTLMQRTLKALVAADLARKMVFLVGPRQVGKTTLAKQILEASGDGVYLSWDRREDRTEIRHAQWPPGRALIVLDELHKFRQWKRWIKGEFDAHRDRLQFLVTVASKPWFAVEAKLSDDEIDPSLRYYRDRLDIPWTYQVVFEGRRDFVEDGVRCLPAHVFFSGLV